MRSLLLFTITFAVLTCGDAQNRATYGEYCNKTVRCYSQSFLTCANETCQCLKESEMTFDLHRFKCVVLAGERCTYTAMESEGEDQQERRWTESLDCVDYAHCNSEGYCNCNSEFHETPEGQCVPNRSYGDSCKIDGECRTSDNLVCVGGKCLCDAEEAVYDRSHGMCVGKVWASGDKYSRCVDNAHMDHGYCECRLGYRSSLEGLCSGSYDMECNPRSSPCINGFSCYGGKCACDFPNYQEYDQTFRECVSKLNGPCFLAVDGKESHYMCQRDTECRNDNGIHECLCKKGYIKSDHNTCKKAHGTECVAHDECDNIPGSRLKCKKGICSCDDFQVYDEQTAKCFGLVGAECSEELQCIDNAHCERHRAYQDQNFGICRCPLGANVDANRKCVVESRN